MKILNLLFILVVNLLWVALILISITVCDQSVKIDTLAAQNQKLERQLTAWQDSANRRIMCSR